MDKPALGGSLLAKKGGPSIIGKYAEGKALTCRGGKTSDFRRGQKKTAVYSHLLKKETLEGDREDPTRKGTSNETSKLIMELRTQA